MKYGILFLVLGIILSLQAFLLYGLFWLLDWPGVSFGLVGIAYLGLGPCVFGKRPSGTMAWYSVAVLLPFLLLTWTTWRLMRRLSSEECYNEVVPGLFIGRRPLPGEVPDAVTLIVDLTAEFPECHAVRSGRTYIAAPMLDTGITDERVFGNLVHQVVHWNGPVYIHCAQGHGRTGLLAIAVLIAKGHSTTLEAALTALQTARPRLGLSKEQLAFLRRVCR